MLPLPGPSGIKKMSAQALMEIIFYEKMIEDLDPLPVSVQEWIRGMKETFNEIVYSNSWALRHVPNFLKTKEICIKVVEKDPWLFGNVPEYLKTQEMYDKAVRDYLFSLQFVPDWFVTYEQLNLWYDDNYVYNDNRMIEWYDS